MTSGGGGILSGGAYGDDCNDTNLTTNLSSNFVVRQSVGREDWNLLPTGNRVHDVDSRDARLDHFLRVDTRVGIDGLTLDIQVILSHDGGPLVNGFSGSVENSAEHVFRNWGSQNVACKLASCFLGVDA